MRVGKRGSGCRRRRHGDERTMITVPDALDHPASRRTSTPKAGRISGTIRVRERNPNSSALAAVDETAERASTGSQFTQL